MAPASGRWRGRSGGWRRCRSRRAPRTPRELCVNEWRLPTGAPFVICWPTARASLVELGLGKRHRRWSVQHCAIGGETRAVTGAVPAFFGGVPVNDAPQMRTDRRPHDQRALSRTENRQFVDAAPDDAAFSRRHLGRIIGIAASDQIRKLRRDVAFSIFSSDTIRSIASTPARKLVASRRATSGIRALPTK